jgi:valyl-tRNA synthetase
MNLKGDEADLKDLQASLRLHDRWILTRLDRVVDDVTHYLDGYFFGEAARLLYDFVWGELCDWYLEMVKPALRGEEGKERQQASRVILRHVFNVVLRLLHPIIPFATEELWRAFGFGDQVLDLEEWPKDSGHEDLPALAEMDLFQEAIRNIRNLRAEAGVPPTQTVPRILLALQNNREEAVFKENADLVALLTHVAKVDFRDVTKGRPARCLSAVLSFGEIYFEVEGLLDVDQEIARLGQEVDKIAREISRSRGKLGNEKFISRAPAEVVETERNRLAEAEKLLNRYEENIKSLSQA